MPATLTALFAVAIHGARRLEADPSELHRAAAILVTAAGARKLHWTVEAGSLLLNGIPLPSDSPGVELVREAMVHHGAATLRLPAALSAEQWGNLAEVLATAPGIYPSSEHIGAAILGIIPGAEFTASLAGVIGSEGVVEDSNRETPGLKNFVRDESPTDPSLASREADRADFSDLLDPLMEAGRSAYSNHDWPELLGALRGMHQLANRSDKGTAKIIARERSRIVTHAALETMVRLLPASGRDSAIAQSFGYLGREGAEAILDGLATNPPRPERRMLIETLLTIPEAEAALVDALQLTNEILLRDAIECLGRLGATGSIGSLGALLRHPNLDVKTAAWHALEAIGTPEALRKL